MEPSSTLHIEVQGKSIEVEENGYLKCQEDWSEDVGNYLSKVDGIELSKDHWEIINFVRRYYFTYQNSPHPKMVAKKLNRQLGTQKYSVKYIFILFPEHPIRKACKYGGIPFVASPCWDGGY